MIVKVDSCETIRKHNFGPRELGIVNFSLFLKSNFKRVHKNPCIKIVNEN